MSNMATLYTPRARQRIDWVNALRQWLFQPAQMVHTEEDEQVQQAARAFHRAYRRFAQRYPQWVSRRFDDEFLRQAVAFGSANLRPRPAAFAACSGYQLAWAWDRQFGMLYSDHIRTRQMAELVEIANQFLQIWQTARNS